jgi:hypothetical protein
MKTQENDNEWQLQGICFAPPQKTAENSVFLAIKKRGIVT